MNQSRESLIAEAKALNEMLTSPSYHRPGNPHDKNLFTQNMLRLQEIRRLLRADAPVARRIAALKKELSRYTLLPREAAKIQAQIEALAADKPSFNNTRQYGPEQKLNEETITKEKPLRPAPHPRPKEREDGHTLLPAKIQAQIQQLQQTPHPMSPNGQPDESQYYDRLRNPMGKARPGQTLPAGILQRQEQARANPEAAKAQQVKEDQAEAVRYRQGSARTALLQNRIATLENRYHRTPTNSLRTQIEETKALLAKQAQYEPAYAESQSTADWLDEDIDHRANEILNLTNNLARMVEMHGEEKCERSRPFRSMRKKLYDLQVGRQAQYEDQKANEIRDLESEVHRLVWLYGRESCEQSEKFLSMRQKLHQLQGKPPTEPRLDQYPRPVSWPKPQSDGMG